MGLKDLNLSQNPIGNVGASHLCESLDHNNCLVALNISECDIDDVGMNNVHMTMARNISILWLDVTRNHSKLLLTAETNAEAETNRLLKDLQNNPMSVDTGTLSKPVYVALRNKVHTLPEKTGFALHDNPSFNMHLSTMKDAVHSAFLPSRRFVYTETIGKNPVFSQRLKDSMALGHKMFCARVIAQHVMRWYKIIRERNKIRAAMALQRALQEKEDAFNMNNY